MARLKVGSTGTKSRMHLAGGTCRGVACCLLALLIVPTNGCVEQLLTIDSDPAGAVVSLNGQEIGRTPVTTTFMWYGFYDANVRKDGFQTLKIKSPVIAPWWQWVPFDLVAAIIPIHLTDQHFVHYTLKPITESLNDPQRLLRQGERLRAELETGANEPRARPVKPATSKPATSKPANPESGPGVGSTTIPKAG